MIAILPIQPDVLQLIAEETELAAEGPVWGYLAADGKTMLGYVIVEKAEPVRVIALQCEDFAIAEFVDSSKLELQRIVREGLDILRKENA